MYLFQSFKHHPALAPEEYCSLAAEESHSDHDGGHSSMFDNHTFYDNHTMFGLNDTSHGGKNV